jgi:hypothetical protein
MEFPMDTKDLLRSGLARAWSSFEMTQDGLSDAELLLRPVDGANHLAWQLGHLVASEHRLGEMITTGSMPPLPEGFADRYTKETAADDDPAHFLSRAEYMSLYSAQREGLLEQLDKIPAADLDKPAPDWMQQIAANVGNIFMLAGDHQLMHSGQCTVVRRKLGKPIVF